ncbi:nuclear envelope integral membrane protein 1-like [Ptychodera flava]|uniref:nuclear envelope integral membrane protein 1-like n=1 Tax=Ptychodera flava TaxID=63121 RepID=UPI00396A1048
MAPFNLKIGTRLVQAVHFLLLGLVLVHRASGIHEEFDNKYEPIFEGEEIKTPNEGFQVYCYRGNANNFVKYMYIFGCLEIQFHPPTGVNNCDLITGPNETVVHQMRETLNPLQSAWKQLSQSFLSISPTTMTDHLKLSPFTKTCFGLECNRIIMRPKLRVVDPKYIALFLVGVLLFLQADRLSRSVIFYYGTGISAGVLLSLLIVIYIMGKFVPAKKAMVAFVLFGWSFALYVLQWLWTKFIVERTFLEGTHVKIVAGYIALSALISFAVCYRYGPVTERRTLNLIKWSVWLVSWLLIYNSMQIPEASISVILILWTWSVFPTRVSRMAITKWRIWFPPKVKLLSEDEYMIQADRETKIALQQLRKFCQSEQCDAWKIISRLRSPSRFARFIEGEEHHITDGEFAAHVLDSDTSFEEYRRDDGGDADEINVTL